MSEPLRQAAELEVIPGRVIFTDEQLAELQHTVVNEVALVMRAREIYDQARRLADMDNSWWSSEDVLSAKFSNFFEDDERIKHGGKVFDIYDLHMPLEMTLETEHSSIRDRETGFFDLDALNLENGQVIISSVVKKDNPSDLESENEAWFAFVLDPNMPEQAVNIVYIGKDDDGMGPHQALLPVLAGELPAVT